MSTRPRKMRMDTLRTLRNSGDELRVQHLRCTAKASCACLTAIPAATRSGALLVLATVAGTDDARIVLLEGAAQPLSLPLQNERKRSAGN